jgi:two-component system OmpR family sensor kinase
MARTLGVDESRSTRSASTCAGWIRAAAGGDAATVRIALLDPSDRLRVVACEGTYDGSERLRSRRRRTVLLTGKALQMHLGDSEGLTLSIFPLRSNERPFGVVEIVVDSGTIVRPQSLMPFIEHTTTTLLSAGGTSPERPVDHVEAVVGLASELLWANSATEAVGTAVNGSFDHLGRPIAGFLPDRDGWGWFLASSAGIDFRGSSRLRQAVRSSDKAASPRTHRSQALGRHVSEVTGCRDVRSTRAGAAILVVGDPHPDDADFMDGVAAMLASALGRVGLDGVRPVQDRSRDVGIAWLAHELKGPLIEAHAALGRAATSGTLTEARALVGRAGDEIARLSELIDPLLWWSTGSESLDLRRLDLAKVTGDAVSSGLGLNGDRDRVSIAAADRPFVLADSVRLTIAIVNVVRNALVHSPSGSPVDVRVEKVNGSARVVVRDRGPGIPPEDQASVFDPFTTGRGRSSSNQGSGLGLFIARRVVEAHAGSIFLRPTRSGATFVLELPAEGRRPSES